MNVNQTPSKKSLSMSILWGMIIPQSILIALNIRGWTLISGEANNQEINIALSILLFELVIIAISFSVFWLQRIGKIQIGWKSALFSLLIHSAYMWVLMIYISAAIPNSIQPWILNEGNVGRWNITLFMSGAFLSLYALCKSFFSSISAANGGLVVLLAAIGMPLAWYLFVTIVQPAWLGQYSVIIGVLIGTLIVVIFLGAIIRFFDNIIHKPFSTNLVDKHYVISALLGLLAPLSGLALNQQIPFPADFQSTSVYVLTIVNGLILLLRSNGERLTSVKLFLRCFTFPFIFYFFLVFLPFLPLSLIATLAMGTGFLMLTPLALGLFQARITLNEYKLTKTSVGQPKAVLIAILGLSILPSYFILQAALDKSSLNTSLEYFYSHDPSEDLLSEVKITRSASALLQLRDRKLGVQLPYISGFYNRVVFGDMVLSDTKISRMYELLTGSVLPEEKTSVFGSRRNSRRAFPGGRGVIAPKRDVSIRSLKVFGTSKSRSTIRLTLENTSNDTHSLFVERLDLPEGIFVSGLRLKIEDEWVTGRVFDRKTALWVFQKITEVRRDPALLYYHSSNQAELRVYPFPSLGIREVEIDFQYHPKIDSQITIGDKKIDLNPSFNSPSVVSQSGITLVHKDISSLAFQRESYIHFILDYSSQAAGTESYAKRVAKVVEELNGASFRITAANIGVSSSTLDELLDTSDIGLITKHIENIQLRKVGGLWVQQAMAKEILRISKNINQTSFKQTPIFVVISDHDLGSDKDGALNTWNWLIPDMQGWYSYTNSQLEWHHLDSSRISIPVENVPENAVIAIQEGSEIFIFPANQSSIHRSNNIDGLNIFNSHDNSFMALAPSDTVIRSEPGWANSAKIWSDWKMVSLNPFNIELQRGDFLERSRAKNILLPLTSLIVVESPSQWEILKRKEEQSLSNHSGLDFEEEQQTPEPPWWLLLAGLLIFLYFRERKTTTTKKFVN